MSELTFKKILAKNGVVMVRFKQSGNKLSDKTYTYFIPDYINPEDISKGTEVIVDSPYGGLSVVVVDVVHRYNFTNVTANLKPIITVVDVASYEDWTDRVYQAQTMLLEQEMEQLREDTLGTLKDNKKINKLLGFNKERK